MKKAKELFKLWYRSGISRDLGNFKEFNELGVWGIPGCGQH